jgi:hypothetical protein
MVWRFNACRRQDQYGQDRKKRQVDSSGGVSRAKTSIKCMNYGMNDIETDPVATLISQRPFLRCSALSSAIRAMQAHLPPEFRGRAMRLIEYSNLCRVRVNKNHVPKAGIARDSTGILAKSAYYCNSLS